VESRRMELLYDGLPRLVLTRILGMAAVV